MFQSFAETARPEQGPPRLEALRAEMARDRLDAFLVPRADMYQGEYVASREERLAWLTGFTGSAGYCVVLRDRAALFVDGRYRVQARAQVADVFERVDWPETQVWDWIAGALPEGGRVGVDPWLTSVEGLRKLEAGIGTAEVVRCENLVDRVWDDQPAAPVGPVSAQPLELAGWAHGDKIAGLAAEMGEAQTTVITLPDSIAWLLNIRGTDIPRNPVPHATALLHASGSVTLFIAKEKLADLGDHLGDAVTLAAPGDFTGALSDLPGPVRIDPASCPVAVADILAEAGIAIDEAKDPCLLPKARKSEAEIAGARAAHARDAAAMVRFLAWLDAQAPGSLTEIDVVTRLEAERRATEALLDISFETISGAGPHGAIVHYRVTESTNARVEEGQLLLVDSGGQYRDGTTDITRTVPVGEVGPEERADFTRVLRGMIAISRLRWPKGLAGRDIEAIARAPLWQAGRDYAHGTGHGVGSYLSVHEGPQGLSRRSSVPLEPGMILSNEPGFYREGAYGIRIENLIVVQEAAPLPGGTMDAMLTFETLTYVPIDRRLIVPEMLTAEERDWLNAYHATCHARLETLVEGEVRDWLDAATAPI
ncbi:X-Pro aminopeptidase [Roseivivax halodurans JCM 10272]|uniref:X-Pro aminopeptidase n=1 Tax=Roseivivax halodurans JCM 10272 TaxID=1449350 RepID=X7EJS8_9RHOB|nr:aminopeptidase P family protein [Roseivivax halodurans]ETX16155.1 X-Pro aminopeptidase [Roseivivax halodurans JCM 10272]